MHSATKGIAGHNDALLGVIAGERELIDAVWAWHAVMGAQASPFDAWNGIRGIRSLPARVRQQCDDRAAAGPDARGPPRRWRRCPTRGSSRTRSTTSPGAR